MPSLLDGRRALITGAASGIGAEIARRFAAEGAAVAVLDIDAAGAKSVAGPISGHAVACDVAVPDSVARGVGEAVAALGGLDILVNAAGILARQPFESVEPDLWRSLFEINLRGPSLVIRAALPALRAAGDAAIVNIASLSALRPSPGTSAYAATKAGLLMLGKCLAEELAPIRRPATASCAPTCCAAWASPATSQGRRSFSRVPTPAASREHRS